MDNSVPQTSDTASITVGAQHGKTPAPPFHGDSEQYPSSVQTFFSSQKPSASDAANIAPAQSSVSTSTSRGLPPHSSDPITASISMPGTVSQEFVGGNYPDMPPPPPLHPKIEVTANTGVDILEAASKKKPTLSAGFKLSFGPQLSEELLQQLAGILDCDAVPTLPPSPRNLDSHPRDTSIRNDEHYDPTPRTLEKSEQVDLVNYCNGLDLLDYETVRHHLPGTPDVIICTYCFNKYISKSPAASRFVKTRKKLVACRFDVPRITNVLLPTALQTGDFSAVCSYISIRGTVTDCFGQRGVKSSTNIGWFRPVDSRLENFLVCEACYGDRILGGSLAHKFEANKLLHPTDQIWSCDFSNPFIQRAYDANGKLQNSTLAWETFVTATQEYLALPQCTRKEPVPTAERKWWRPKRHIPNLLVCEQCFWNKVALTEVKDYFELLPSSMAASDLTTACALSRTSMDIAFNHLVEYKMAEVFWDAANSIAASPACEKDGIAGGSWYTLKGGCKGFDICEGCYGGIFKPFRLAGFLESRGMIAKTVVCSLNIPGNQRAVPAFDALSKTMGTGVWSPFKEYVTRWSNIAPCVKDEPITNGTWFGYEGCYFCAECFETIANGTSLSQEMPLQGVERVEETACSMYSPRMRALWDDACSKGSEVDLVAAARSRAIIWASTVPRLKSLREFQQQKLESAANNEFMATTYASIHGMNMAISNYDGHWHGSSDLGWHTTSDGATSEAYTRQAMADRQEAADLALLTTMADLESQWKQVE
jgi:hypothetical protein